MRFLRGLQTVRTQKWDPTTPTPLNYLPMLQKIYVIVKVHQKRGGWVSVYDRRSQHAPFRGHELAQNMLSHSTRRKAQFMPRFHCFISMEVFCIQTFTGTKIFRADTNDDFSKHQLIRFLFFGGGGGNISVSILFRSKMVLIRHQDNQSA